MLKIRFHMFGEKQITRRLQVLASQVSDLTPAWGEIQKSFIKIEKEQFASQGSRSAKWAKLSPRYKRRKDAVRPGRPILVFDGHLKRSLTDPSDPDHVYAPTRLSMAIGSAIGYGAAHQTGMPENNLPMRRPISLIKTDRTRWLKIIHDHVHSTDDVRNVRKSLESMRP